MQWKDNLFKFIMVEVKIEFINNYMFEFDRLDSHNHSAKDKARGISLLSVFTLQMFLPVGKKGTEVTEYQLFNMKNWHC